MNDRIYLQIETVIYISMQHQNSGRGAMAELRRVIGQKVGQASTDRNVYLDENLRTWRRGVERVIRSKTTLHSTKVSSFGIENSGDNHSKLEA